ncbi:primary-amine oxidase [Actinosynnema sp. NPDC059797]
MTETPHPLDPLTAAEVAAARDALVAANLVGPTTRFPSVLLAEPAKDVVRAHRPGDPVARRARVVLLDVATGAAGEAVVDVGGGGVVAWRELDPADGRPAILFEEYDRVAELVRADPRWQEALRRRGVADRSLAFVAPLSPGSFPEDEPRRFLRALTFLRDHVDDSPWAHPVEGLLAEVDLIGGRVLRVVDSGDVPVPAEPGNYAGVPPRTTLKPISITQPEGAGFTVSGHEVVWEGWRLRVGFNAREGLTLHRISFDGRSVLHRASVAEMVVPYGDPAPWRNWISYFDAGEYLLGKNANPLRLGCDCLGLIHYFDAVVADDHGRPVTIPRAICLHEEDHGVLWKHTNTLTGAADVRRARRLVISSFSTIGNYDYGFYWYFHLDGTVELEAKLTGVVFCGAGEGSPHAAPVAPGLVAPVHQHLFCARLDAEVAGTANTVDEVDFVRLPTGPGNPRGNAFTTRATALERESTAARLADPAAGRTWVVRSAEDRNRLGLPRAYQLVPSPGPTLLAQPGSSVAGRAAFATRHLWVTRFAEDERHPAGEFPNQHPGGAGLPAWTARDRPLVDADVVLWHVFGPTHLPRPEDWPVMPVDRCGFLFRPWGFCDRNPALDVPGLAGRSHCPPGSPEHEC